MRRLVLTISAAAFLLGAGAACAQVSADFALKRLDKNGDGAITRDEWLAAKRPPENFDKIDANHDGKITLEELKAALAARAKLQGGP